MEKYVRMVMRLQREILAELRMNGVIDPGIFLPTEMCLAQATTEAKILARPTEQIQELSNYVQQMKRELL